MNDGSLQEIELRLQVAPAALPGLRRALAATAARHSRMRLQAVYVDTPERALAAAGIALRLRKEGRRWVQTIKLGPLHATARGEHNVAVDAPPGTRPAIDPARHAGTPMGEALAAVLAAAQAPLVERYRTDITRSLTRRRTRFGQVELALDVGEIVADDPAGGEPRRWPVRELEIELLSGSPRAVFDTAQRWIDAHGLWLDSRSKAERGDRLARGELQAAAVKAGATASLPADASPSQAWRAFVEACLAQALPNASELAAGTGQPEHVHQLRVALRRLRSAARLCAGWPGVPPSVGPDAAPFLAQAAELFRALGVTRDADVMAQGWGPLVAATLEAAGLPPLVPPPAAADEPSALLRRPEASRLWLQLIGQTFEAEPAGPAGATARARVAERLDAWHRRTTRDAKRFESLDDAALHALRKRLKRLRYATEFAEPWFGSRAARRYARSLARLQDALGAFNDHASARALVAALAPSQPQALYALGWLDAQRDALHADIGRALKRWRKVQPYWR
ncbi:CHAD domain-containing protein [Caldimonas sp. KR1-144]|uniref:CYTH and CHAD domain-containing protein n=1 Tax=Caldimonas sp. KR1-144 TaxID=3400911 RepID=UPI003C0D8146